MSYPDICNKIHKLITFKHKQGTPQNAIIILFHNDKVQICRSRKRIRVDGVVIRNLQHAGGRIEPGESPWNAAIREFIEETIDDLPIELQPRRLTVDHILSFGFGNSGNTAIFIARIVPELSDPPYSGVIPPPNVIGNGKGEMEYIYYLSLDEIYSSLLDKYDGFEWRRCTIYSFKTLKPILYNYAKLHTFGLIRDPVVIINR